MKTLLTVLLTLTFASLSLTEDAKSRHRRSVILLPANSSITITFDLSMPVYPLQAQSAFYNMRVPFRFFIPSYNQLTAYYGRYESKEDDDSYNLIDRFHASETERAHEERRFIYKNLESLLSGFGMDGMSCVQRAICELSSAPIFHNDIFGNVLNLIFTPPRVADFSRWISGHRNKKEKRDAELSELNQVDAITGGSEIDDDQSYRDEYESAYHHGKKGRCQEEYAQSCPISLFSTFDI